MASSARQRPSLTIDPDNLASPFREIRDYWATKCGGRAMPRRADIDPLELPPQHMPYLSILDVLPDTDDFRFRLLGTGITERLGRDSTGRTVREVYAAAQPAMRDWMLDSYRAVVTHKRPVLKRGTLGMVQKEFVDFEALHLPLSEDGERVSMLFGLTHFLDRKPRKG
jgi:hypothetical protein